MLRISVSVTMCSAPPVSVPPSSHSVSPSSPHWRKPSWLNWITSPSSALTKPAGPNRLAWRRRRRVISSLSSAKPKCVQMKSNVPSPRGTMWRVDSEFTCCWMMRLGNSVIIVTLGMISVPGFAGSGTFHHGSGTTSSRRVSFSAMSALKLVTPCVTVLFWPPSLRRDSITAWRPCSSMIMRLRWSARHSPKVTNQVWSRPGWYGSLMFSIISFQLPGMRWRLVPSSLSSRPAKMRSSQGMICGPRYCSSGSASSLKVANTSPCSTATRSRVSPCSFRSKPGGMPPLTQGRPSASSDGTPSLNGSPASSPLSL